MKKKILILFLTAVLATLFTLSFSGTVMAESNSGADEVKPVYYDFGTASSVLTDGNDFLVADESGLHLINQTERKKISDTVISELCGTVSNAYALSNGKIYTVAEDFTSLSEISGVSGVEHIAYLSNALYYSSGNTVTALSGTPKSAEGEIAAMAATDTLYYSVKNGDRYDIYSYDGTLVYPLVKSGKIFGGQQLYSINKSGDLIRITDDGELPVFSDAFVETACGYDGGVCFATDEGEIRVVENGEVRLIAASASNEDGFYNYPVKAITRFDKLFVCDYLNDRVAITSNDKLQYIPLFRPTSIAVDDNGRIFVAHSNKQISVYSSDIEFEIKYELTDTVNEVVAAHDGSVYALSGNTVYSLKEDGFVATSDTAKGIYAADGLYLIKDDGVYKDGESVVSATGIISIAIDGSGQIFTLENNGSNKLVRYSGGTGNEITAENTLDGAVSISVSRSEQGDIAYGDIIIADRNAHRILTEKATVTGATVSTPQPPSSSEYDQKIIRHTLYPCALYGSLNESDIALHLTKNRNIIVLKYDAYQGMAYCATENLTGELIYGFVFRTALSEPLDYLQPPAPEGTIYASEVNLYALPSFDAEKIKDFNRGDRVEMLEFASYSSGGSGWYKVTTSDETTGYVPSNSVSIRNFIPGDERPQYNAKIISYKGSVCAPVYLKNSDGEYEQVLSEYLFTGTQVEIVGTFDESEKYAEIKYYDENLGTLTCFVEIVYLEYNSITLVQTIAIAVAVLTFILLVFLLVRLYMKNRKL